MKQLITCSLILLFTIHYANAQSANNKNFISFSIGPSFPTGHFGSTDRSDQYAGAAVLGAMTNASFTHKLNNHFGLTGMLYAQRNQLNTSALAKEFAATHFYYSIHQNGVLVPYSDAYYSNWSVKKVAWYTESVLVGITGEWPLQKSDVLSVTARAMVGGAYVESPALKAESKTPENYAVISQTKASAPGFAYLGGVGIKYKLNRHLYGLLGADYFGTSRIKFKNVTSGIVATNGLQVPGIYVFGNSKYPINENLVTADLHQSISAINVNFSLGFKF